MHADSQWLNLRTLEYLIDIVLRQGNTKTGSKAGFCIFTC